LPATRIPTRNLVNVIPNINTRKNPDKNMSELQKGIIKVSTDNDYLQYRIQMIFKHPKVLVV